MNHRALPARPVVAIVGGGFSGAAIAYHLAKATAAGTAEIVVIEPRAVLGAGLAYSTSEPSHRINVPAAKMSLVSKDGEDFARWLVASGDTSGDPDALTAKGDAFPQRSLFGRYVADRLAPFVAEGRIRHERKRAGTIRHRDAGGFDVTLGDGRIVRADIVAMATTHPLPAVPAPLRPLTGARGFVENPYDLDALAAIGRDARVLVVGNGLTAADVVAALDRRGHTGTIIALSRHGLRSRGHPAIPAPPYGDFATTPSRTALGLFRRIRATLAEAAREGLGWHPVIDTVRNQGSALWTALPEPERRRIVRHLRSLWDVHRFRIAPQVETVLDRRAAEGRFSSIAASLVAARRDDDGIAVSYRPRHSTAVVADRFDAVVNTTGPAHRSVVAGDGPLGRLHRSGLVRLDAVGLGLDVARDGRAIGVSGLPVDGLYIGGPLARGTFGELMGLLEVTRYAEFVAAEIAARLVVPGAALPSGRSSAAA